MNPAAFLCGAYRRFTVQTESAIAVLHLLLTVAISAIFLHSIFPSYYTIFILTKFSPYIGYCTL